jgi:tRNA threonylcarbamoyladenosine biosynthesis protein TsaE
MRTVHIVNSAKETQRLAFEFVKKLSPGNSILLEGELGSGKTTFVQGAAKGLGVKKRVTSPTFVLIRTYKGKLGVSKINLYHIDLYRVADPGKIDELGLSEIFEDANGIVFIEWGRRSGRTKFTWKINFEILSKNERKITIKKI